MTEPRCHYDSPSLSHGEDHVERAGSPAQPAPALAPACAHARARKATTPVCVSRETSETLSTPAEVPRALPIAPDQRHSRRAGSPRAPTPPRHPPPADADVTMHERRPVTRGHRSSWNQACDLCCREGSATMPRQGRHQRRLHRERQNRKICRRPIARRQGRGGQTPPRLDPNRPSQPDHSALEWVPRPKRRTLYSDDSRRVWPRSLRSCSARLCLPNPSPNDAGAFSEESLSEHFDTDV